MSVTCHACQQTTSDRLATYCSFCYQPFTDLYAPEQKQPQPAHRLHPADSDTDAHDRLNLVWKVNQWNWFLPRYFDDDGQTLHIHSPMSGGTKFLMVMILTGLALALHRLMISFPYSDQLMKSGFALIGIALLLGHLTTMAVPNTEITIDAENYRFTAHQVEMTGPRAKVLGVELQKTMMSPFVYLMILVAEPKTISKGLTMNLNFFEVWVAGSFKKNKPELVKLGQRLAKRLGTGFEDNA